MPAGYLRGGRGGIVRLGQDGALLLERPDAAGARNDDVRRVGHRSRHRADTAPSDARHCIQSKALQAQGGLHRALTAIQAIAAKIGCSGETLRNCVRQSERDQGARPGQTTDERERIKALERENRELRQANEILRKASAYFAFAELDRRSRP